MEPIFNQLSFSGLITLQFVSIVWILFVFFIHDRILAFFVRILLKKWLKLGIKLKISSAFVDIFEQRVILRGLEAETKSLEWLAVEQLELGLNRHKYTNQVLDLKPFHYKFVDSRVVLSGENSQFLTQSLLRMLQVDKSVVEFDHLSLFMHSSESPNVLHLGVSQLGCVWTEIKVREPVLSQERANLLKKPEITSQLLTKCVQLAVKRDEKGSILDCDEVKLKMSWFRRPWESKIGTETKKASKSLEISGVNVQIELCLFQELVSRLAIESTLLKLHLNGLKIRLAHQNHLILVAEMAVFGKIFANESVNLKLSRTKVNFICSQTPIFESDSIALTANRTSGILSIQANLTENSIIRAKHVIPMSHVLKIPPNLQKINLNLTIFLNGLMLELGSLITVEKISAKFKTQSIDRSTRGLLVLDQVVLTDTAKSVEISTERLTSELKKTTIDTKWQLISAPVHAGRFRRPQQTLPPLNAATTSSRSSFDSYLYTYVVDEETGSEFDRSSEESDPSPSDTKLSNELNSLYLSVVQVRAESWVNLGKVYATRFEVIFGDLFGTIEAEIFEKISQIVKEVYSMVTDEFRSFQILRHGLKQTKYTSVRVLSSLTHFNIVKDVALFNMVAGPFDYAACNLHEMAVSPDLINLNLFVCVGGKPENGKYADLLDCGSVSIKFALLKRNKVKNEAEIEVLKVCDRQTRRLEFLWTLESQSKCVCGSIFDQSSRKLYDFNGNTFPKPCLYSRESFGFGSSILVESEPIFFSYRSFFPEIKTGKITGTLQVVSCLEETTDPITSKAKFQPSEMLVYEDELNLFLNELNSNQSVTKSLTQVPHMNPPYFSADFKTYVRFLPIIRNVSRCTANIVEPSSQSMRIEYSPSARLFSDLEIERKKSSRRLTNTQFFSFDDTRKKKKSGSSFKFSVGQLKPDFKPKPPKAVAVLTDKRLRVEEIFIETVVKTDENQTDNLQSLELAYPDTEPNSKPSLFIVFSLLEIRTVASVNLVDYFKLKVKRPEPLNLFHLRFKSKNEPNEFETMWCVNRLVVEGGEDLQAKNVVVLSNARRFPVNKLVIVEEICVDLDRIQDFSIDFVHFEPENDNFIGFKVKKMLFKCPEQVAVHDLTLEFLNCRDENYLELRLSANIYRAVLEKSSFLKIIAFLTKTAALVGRKLVVYNFNVEVKLNPFEFMVGYDDFGLDCKVSRSTLHVSNKFPVSNCRFTIDTLANLVFTRAEIQDSLANVDLKVEKRVRDCKIFMTVDQNARKYIVVVDLVQFVDATFNSRDDIRIPKGFVSVALENEPTYLLLLELDSVRASLGKKVEVGCELARFIHFSCGELPDFKFAYPAIEEFSARFGAKQLLLAYFPEKLSPTGSWLYLNLFKFEADYGCKSELNLVEELSVGFEATAEETHNDQVSIDQDQLRPKQSVCLWLASKNQRALFSKTTPDPHALLDFALMQLKSHAVVYSVQPVAKFSTLKLLFTFETGKSRRVFWRYSLESPTVFINRDLAKNLWAQLVVAADIKSNASYNLSVMSSESAIKIGSLKSWKAEHAERVLVAEFSFLDVEKLPVLIKERSLFFYLLSNLGSIFNLLNKQ